MYRLFQPELLPGEAGIAERGQPSPPQEGRRYGLSSSVWYRSGIIVIGMALILLLLLLYDLPYLKANATSAGEFLFSAQFLFFCCVAVVLSVRKISGLLYELSAFVLAGVYLFIFYGDNFQLFKMAGDNICQVAYWNILFHPNLSGGVGVSFTKPGQILLLGLIYQLSLLGGQIVFKIGLTLIMAACVWALVAVATELGGRVSGILAFFFSLWAFEGDMVFAESTIYVVTTVFAGLRLYYYHPRCKSLGRLLLILSLLFRIETIAVLAVVGLIHLARKEWRELVLLSAGTLVALLVFIGVVLDVQGSFSRINSGAAAGYTGQVLYNGQMDPALQKGKIPYIVNTVTEEFADNYYIRSLLALTTVGIFGAFTFRRKRYLAVFATIFIILANVFLFGGSIELIRYFSLVYAFACSIGVASLVRFGDFAVRRGQYIGIGCLFAVTVALMAGFDFSRFNAYPERSSDSLFSASAMEILADKNLPKAMRLMTEDDLLSHLVVMSPERYPTVTSLQSFNVASEQKRRDLLARTDFIWIDRNLFPFYYLYYQPVPEWRFDSFRKMVTTFLEDPVQSRSLYGFRFTKVAATSTHLLLKVEG